MYKLYPFYIIICDIGISFTSTCKLVHPLSRPSESEGAKHSVKTCFRFPSRLSARVLGAQIELAEIAEGVSGKDVCTLEVKFDPDFIEITRREQVVCDLDLFGAHTIYSRTR